MYFISIIAIIAVTVIMAFSVSVQSFLNLPSILLVLLLAIPVLISSGLFKDFNNAFHILFSKKRSYGMAELKRALEAVNLMIWTFLCSGLFLFLLTFIVVLHALDTLETLGPKISVSWLCFIYGTALALLLLPVRSILQVRIIEFMPEQENEILQEKTTQNEKVE